MASMKDKVDKCIKKGWIRSVMMIEVMAITKEAAKKSLEAHIKKMENEEGTLVSYKEFKEIDEYHNPFPTVKLAYSAVVEIEVFSSTFDGLVSLVINYAPSSVEVISPEKITIDMGEGQGILNTISEMIHKFASTGLGGIMVQPKD